MKRVNNNNNNINNVKLTYNNKGSLSRNGGNPKYDLIEAIELLPRFGDNNHEIQIETFPRILSSLSNVFSSKASIQVITYLLRSKATTAFILQVQIGLTQSTVYRTLKNLLAMSIIEPVLQVPKILRRDGPKPKVWGLAGRWTQEDIARCITLHYRCQSPKYRLAEEIAQTILEDYIKRGRPMEIRLREINIAIRSRGASHSISDIADLTAICLAEQGMKVWR